MYSQSITRSKGHVNEAQKHLATETHVDKGFPLQCLRMEVLPNRVVLFRTPAQPDPYHVQFAGSGYIPISIQVLSETFLTGDLREIIASEEVGWEGVILMSRRGAEGWIKAVEALLSDSSESALLSLTEAKPDTSKHTQIAHNRPE